MQELFDRDGPQMVM